MSCVDRAWGNIVTLELLCAVQGGVGCNGGERQQWTASRAHVRTMQGTGSSSSGEPVGEWTLTFEDNAEVRRLFADGQIEDIVFVITFGGTTPAWPG